VRKDYPCIQPERDHKDPAGKDGLRVYNVSFLWEHGTQRRASSLIGEIISTQEIC